MNIIIILGKMRSGKSTIGNIINELYPNYTRIPLNHKQKSLSKLFDLSQGKNRELIYTITSQLESIDKYIWIRYIVNKIRLKSLKYIILEGILLKYEYDYLCKVYDRHIFFVIKIDISNQLQKKRVCGDSINRKIISNKYENVKLKINYNLVINMDFYNNLDIDSFVTLYKKLLKSEIDEYFKYSTQQNKNILV